MPMVMIAALVVHLALTWLVTSAPARPAFHCHPREASGGCVAPETPEPPIFGCIDPPTRTKYVRPVYPDEARRLGVHGVVILEIVIDPWGRVGTVKVLRSLPPLDDAAIDAVRHWTFRPTCLGGRAKSVAMTVGVAVEPE
jgi:TonB family protein